MPNSVFQSLLTIFAIFGLGCFLAGGATFSLIYWMYRQNEKYIKAYKRDIHAQIDDMMREVEI